MKKGELLAAYWHTKKRQILLNCSCILIFGFTFFLYQIPLEASLYGASICGVVMMGEILYSFRKYAAHYRKVEKMEKELIYGVWEFPEAENAMEQKYQELLVCLQKKQQKQDLEKEKAYREMTEYYTTWVHQIKTPIAAMRLLLREDTDQGWEISMELFRIEQYVDMVLQYVRLGAKSTDYQIAEYRLDSVIRQAIRKYARLFIKKKIVLDYEEVRIKVITDEKWLLFVIEQILSNALKYTDRGKIRIYLSDEKKKELVIEDTGIGIAPQDLPRVFESGFTGYNGRKEKRSTGIGLYLCRRIMKRLSHTIRIESELGKGTRVILGLGTVALEYE